MSRLISCDGVARDSDGEGQRVIVPHRIGRARSSRWEIACAVYEAAEFDGKVMTYRESHWEIPSLGSWMDMKGRYHRFSPDPGVYYYPEAKP